MNIFIALFLTYLQTHPFEHVQSGVDGVVVQEFQSTTVYRPVVEHVADEPTPTPEPTPAPVPVKPLLHRINAPEPTIENPNPKPKIDPYCGIPWKDEASQERYKACMASPEHDEYMKKMGW